MINSNHHTKLIKLIVYQALSEAGLAQNSGSLLFNGIDDFGRGYFFGDRYQFHPAAIAFDNFTAQDFIRLIIAAFGQDIRSNAVNHLIQILV